MTLSMLPRREWNSWFQVPHSGGLGWAFPCALGAQLAEPDRLCVATMGDGSYIFSNPTACHQIAEALALAVLVVVLNNAEWGAVRSSVTLLYPDGYASRANVMPLTSRCHATVRPQSQARGPSWPSIAARTAGV